MTTELEEIFKSKASFEEHMVNYPMAVSIAEVMQDYPKKSTTRIADLTQNYETWLNVTGNKDCEINQYIVWIITNEKEKIMNSLMHFNNCNNGKSGVFVFKASLNGNKIDFECLLKPEVPKKSKRNSDTPAKIAQYEYWELYRTECDMSEYIDMQIKEPAYQHYQYVSVGKCGLQILQTINTKGNFVASEIGINNNKALFDKLLEHKAEIEEEIGELIWDSKENNKSAKIRKIYQVNLKDKKNYKKAIKEHIKMGAELKAIAHKYL